MATLHGTIETDVPAGFAERGWREFMRRAIYHGDLEGARDAPSSVADIDADDGTVRFLRERDGITRVAVELEYTPHDREHPDDDVRAAQERLERGLSEYHEFVLRRCEEEHCRLAA